MRVAIAASAAVDLPNEPEERLYGDEGGGEDGDVSQGRVAREQAGKEFVIWGVGQQMGFDAC